MHILLKNIFFSLIFLSVAASHGAIHTSTLLGETVDCGAASVGCIVGESMQLDISFDDALFGTVLQETDIQSLAITGLSSGTSTDYVAQFGLNFAALEVDSTGNILQGLVDVNPFPLAPGVFLLSNFDFSTGGTTTPFGNSANFISSVNGDHLGGTCFNGFACATAVPLPAGAGLFVSALFGLIAIRFPQICVFIKNKWL